MPHPTNEAFESLCEDFENQWNPGNSGPAFVKSFIDESAGALAANIELAVELAIIDLERSWFEWSKYISKHAFDLPPQELLASFAELPTIDSYAQQMGHQVRATDACWRELCRAEAMVRAKCGDAIGSFHYQALYNVRLPDKCGLCLRFVKCILEGSSIRNDETDEIPLRGRCRLGRRRSTDPITLQFEQCADGNRILIALHRETSVSRDQLTLELLHPNYAVLTNKGRVRLDATSAVILPEESILVTFPFVLKLPGRKLLFR